MIKLASYCFRISARICMKFRWDADFKLAFFLTCETRFRRAALARTFIATIARRDAGHGRFEAAAAVVFIEAVVGFLVTGLFRRVRRRFLDFSSGACHEENRDAY